MQRLALNHAAILFIDSKLRLRFVSGRLPMTCRAALPERAAVFCLFFPAPEELLIGCELFFLPCVRAEPQRIEAHVPCRPVGIGVEPVMAVRIPAVDLCLRPKVRRPVELRVLRTKPRVRITGLLQIFPALFRRLVPELPVVLIPQGEQLIEMRQMIGRVRERTSRNEQDQMVVPVPHGPVLRRAVPDAGLQDFPGPGAVRMDSLAVAPAVRRKEQGHGEIFLPVRRGPRGILRSVRLAGPGKVSGVLPFFHVHIRDRPLPDAVKLFPVIQLHAGHHAVGHSLRPRIMIAGVLDVTHVSAHGMIDALLFPPVEQGLPDLFELLPALSGFREPCCRKDVLIRNASLRLRHLLRLMDLPDIKKKIGKLPFLFRHIVKTGVIEFLEHKPLRPARKELVAAPDHLRNQSLRSRIDRVRQKEGVPLALSFLQLHEALTEPLHRKAGLEMKIRDPVAGIARKKQAIRPDQHGHGHRRVSRAADRLHLHAASEVKHLAVRKVPHANVPDPRHRVRIPGKSVLCRNAFSLCLRIMNGGRNPLFLIQIHFPEAVHSAAVVIMSVCQRHRDRKVRERFHIRRNVPDSASRIDQKGTVPSLHEVHEFLNDPADSRDVLRHSLRGKIFRLLSHFFCHTVFSSCLRPFARHRAAFSAFAAASPYRTAFPEFISYSGRPCPSSTLNRFQQL